MCASGNEIPQTLLRRAALYVKFNASVFGFIRRRKHRQLLPPARTLQPVLGDAVSHKIL